VVTEKYRQAIEAKYGLVLPYPAANEVSCTMALAKKEGLPIGLKPLCEPHRPNPLQNKILFAFVYTNIILCTQIKRAIVLIVAFVYTNLQKCNFCVHKYNFVYTNKTRNCFEIGICVHRGKRLYFLCTQNYICVYKSKPHLIWFLGMSEFRTNARNSDIPAAIG
jgi:hypothetical protein